MRESMFSLREALRASHQSPQSKLFKGQSIVITVNKRSTQMQESTRAPARSRQHNKKQTNKSGGCGVCGDGDGK